MAWSYKLAGPYGGGGISQSIGHDKTHNAYTPSHGSLTDIPFPTTQLVVSQPQLTPPRGIKPPYSRSNHQHAVTDTRPSLQHKTPHR